MCAYLENFTSTIGATKNLTWKELDRLFRANRYTGVRQTVQEILGTSPMLIDVANIIHRRTQR